eukprot:39342-Chlamydomonas_euryale.AAC.4
MLNARMMHASHVHAQWDHTWRIHTWLCPCMEGLCVAVPMHGGTMPGWTHAWRPVCGIAHALAYSSHIGAGIW